MKFAELRTGDWFEWDNKPFIRLKCDVMSLSAGDFGMVYPPLIDEREVKYLTAFDYQVKPSYAGCGSNEISIKSAPIEIMLEYARFGSLYVKISPYDPSDPDLVVIRTQGDDQGSLYYSRFLDARVRIVDKMCVRIFE